MTIFPNRSRHRASAVAAVLSFVAAGCSGPTQSEFRITPPPGPPAFDAVSDAFEINCGTLNCHGNEARNMRIFGFYGVRLSEKNQPGFAATTPDEYQANFESIIAIEPERISEVVITHGQDAGKWIVLAKGRGTQHHKGGTRIVPGGAMDVCVSSWILAQAGPDGGATGINTDACTAAVNVVPPGADWTQ